MNAASTIARFVLGLVFVVFGLNGFLNFMPMGPVPPLAGQFTRTLIRSLHGGYTDARDYRVCCVTNSYALLATTVLAPVIVNILLFHMFMAPAAAGGRACHRTLGCDGVPVSSAVVAAVPATADAETRVGRAPGPPSRSRGNAETSDERTSSMNPATSCSPTAIRRLRCWTLGWVGQRHEARKTGCAH